MKEEYIVECGEDCIDDLENALIELKGMKEYQDQYNDIKETIEQIKSIMEPYQEILNKQWEQEAKDLNSEYERSVL